MSNNNRNVHTGSSPIRTYTKTIQATEFTRPSNTTAYTIGDVLGTSPASVITLSDVFREKGATGYIVKARLTCNSSTSTHAVRAYFFNTAPTAIEDNSPFTILYNNQSTRLGYIDFPALTTEGSGSTSSNAQWTGTPFHVSSTNDSLDLYVVLVARSATTPVSASKFILEITIDQN